MKKSAILTLAILLFPVDIFAQDVIYLNDGKLMKGRITSESGAAVTIEMENEWREIKFTDIKKVMRNSVPRPDASAAPAETPSRVRKPDPARYHSLDALLTVTNFDYKETVPAPLKSTEKGWVPGILLKYGYHKKRMLAALSVEAGGGDTNYDGTTQAGVPVTGTTGNSFTDGSAVVGYVLPAGAVRLTGYAGIGRRTWERTLGAGTASEYLETYSWNYYPVGLRADFRSGEKFSIGLDACVKIMTGGEIVIGFARMGADSDLTLKLGNKTGYRFSAPIEYARSEKWFFLLTPWYEHSAIGQSNTGAVTIMGGTPYATAYEPASNTIMYGINAGFVYKFSIAPK
ncbi:MAG: hypothetical protein WCW52_05005 [Elusimicrobiales bacterium]